MADSRGTIFWVVLVTLFLLVAGTMVYSIYQLTRITTDDAPFGATVGLLVLSSLAFIVFAGAFVAWTIATYDEGNWLYNLVDKKGAVRKRIESTSTKINALSRIVFNPREYTDAEQERAKANIAKLEKERAALQQKAEILQAQEESFEVGKGPRP